MIGNGQQWQGTQADDDDLGDFTKNPPELLGKWDLLT